MKRIPVVLLEMTVIALAMVLASPSAGALVPRCGPGAHWVDACPPATDHFDHTVATVGIDVDFDCIQDVPASLTGSMDVETGVPSGHSFDTEIVSMNLGGKLIGLDVTLTAGFYNPNYTGGQHSYGAVVEQPGDPALADSFFEVFFELAGPAIPTGHFYNHEPLRMQAVIDRVPPEALYAPPGFLCLPLYDDPVGGMAWGNLVAAQHDTRGPVGGTVELDVNSADPSAGPADGSGPSVPYAALAGGVAAAALALAAGAWYARRRWVR